MRDYEIGYGKPPRRSQFKKGVSANPRGRPRRPSTEIGDVVRSFLSAKTEYREKGRIRKTSRLELAIKRHVTAALNGDVGSAAMLLKMRAQANKFGDTYTGPRIIQIINSPGPGGLGALRLAREKARLAESSGVDGSPSHRIDSPANCQTIANASERGSQFESP